MSVLTAQQIQVRPLRQEESPLLDQMYETFAPLEVALGLPPRDPERRRTWLDTLAAGTNMAAFVEGRLVGHVVLMSTGRLAEMALFVHQDFRRQGVGTALAEAAIRAARELHMIALWVLIPSENTAARHGLRKLGFETAWEGMGEVQMVVRL